MASRYREIQLSQGKIALVDDDDFEKVSAYKWYAAKLTNKIWYAQRNVIDENTGKKKIQMLHRFIMQEFRKLHIDHINNDGLDCRKSNLRVATASQNGMNRGPSIDNLSGFKGVGWNGKSKRWEARLFTGNRNLFLGSFSCAEDAARAYDKKARIVHGEFAYFNFPDEQQSHCLTEQKGLGLIENNSTDRK
jgi:hypothetical protein